MNESRHSFKIYGLNINSTIFFPELLSGDNFPEINIYYDDSEFFSHLEKFEEINFGEYLKILYNKTEAIVLYDNEIIFKVKSGNEIIVNSRTSLNDNFLRSLILSQGFGSLLQQRGYLVLHASSVKINDGAVVFLGSSGNGKSTISLILNKKGYPLISDDILPIKFIDNDFKTFSGFPRIKIWNDIIENLIEDKESLFLIHPESKKFSYSTRENFFCNSLPIKKIYLLKDAKKNSIIDIKPQEALLSIIKNSYNYKMFFDSEKSENLFQCASLTEKVSISVLNVKKSINELNDLVEIIEQDIFESNNL